MAEKKYRVIVSDRAKQMLGVHIHFIANVNKDVAKSKKKEIINAMRYLERMLHRFPFFLKIDIFPKINITKCLFQNGISFFSKSKRI